MADFLGAVKSDLLASTKTKNKFHSNISKEEQVAKQELQRAQQEGEIVIKLADKGGGICVLNLSDYLNEMNKQLSATFEQPDGSVVPFYKKSNKGELDQQKKEIEALIETGNLNGYITDNDARTMAPSGRGGRLYGQPKVHKPIQGDSKIPPCRPIVSQPGSNTEYASKFVDHYSKPLIHNINTHSLCTLNILVPLTLRKYLNCCMLPMSQFFGYCVPEHLHFWFL